MGELIVIPIALLAAYLVSPAFLARLSAFELDEEGARVRNFPWRTQAVPLSAIDRLDRAEHRRVWINEPRASTVLLLLDGSRLRVRALGDADERSDFIQFNNRLEELRRAER
jgi:hypothetical protein